MSGFVFAYGQIDRQNMEQMLDKIAHRGPFLSGIHMYTQMGLAQNYLKADTGGASGREVVPIEDSHRSGLKICCDSQIGNRHELGARFGVTGNAFLQERLLLELYRQYGTEMLQYLDDAIFTFVIADGRDFLAARDLLGIKTLFYGWKEGTLYLASELKSIAAVTDDLYEFPPGHYMRSDGRLVRFAELPPSPPQHLHHDLEEMTVGVREIIKKSVRCRVDFSEATAGLLSGGMDSSVIAHLASELLREKYGKNARLKTLAIGVGVSEDILSARKMAQHINSDHRELIVGLDELLEALHETIYYLESFDPSLVRSSVTNFLISRYAKEQGIEVLLSGEGGDEIFCGYLYLKNYPTEDLFTRQMECLAFLHNNASLRLDRMNQCHSIQVIAPLISGELFRYTLGIPPEYKQRPDGNGKIEKWIFRKAFERDLPESITWRLKQEFSQGSGSAALLPAHFENAVSDKEFKELQSAFPILRSKEECYYFQVFTDYFGAGKAVETVGQWICL